MRSAGHPGHQGTAGVGRASVDAVRSADPGPADPAHRAPRVLSRAVVCAPIRAYRALSAHRLPHCRYWPTCSAYALEAVEVHGPARGLWMALRRIIRCHPWGGFGADPVPPRSVGLVGSVGSRVGA